VGQDIEAGTRQDQAKHGWKKRDLPLPVGKRSLWPALAQRTCNPFAARI